MKAERREELKATIAEMAPKNKDFISKMQVNHGSLLINANPSGPAAMGYARLSDGRVVYIAANQNTAGTALVLEVMEVEPSLIGESAVMPELDFAKVAEKPNFFNQMKRPS